MPEFNQTIFASLPNPRVSSNGANSIEKDENAIKDMEEWLKKLPSKTPFFAFLFLDAVHAAAFPETSEFSVFKPYWKEVNQIKLSNDFDPIPYFNRYKNSVFYTDKNLKSALDSLKKIYWLWKKLSLSLVLITEKNLMIIRKTIGATMATSQNIKPKFP